MYLPHCITVYNVREDTETSNLKVNITVLPHCFLNNKDGETVNEADNRSTANATLYIPLKDTGAYDAIDGHAKEYVSSKIYDASENQDNYWTLDTNGETLFVLGEIQDVATFEDINNKYDYVYIVRDIEINNYGSYELRHIKVIGK